MAKATGPNYNVPFKRRRKGMTNYAKRLALVKSRLPRMVVRKTNSGVLVQFVGFETNGDKVLANCHSSSLEKFGWKPHCNCPTGYLSGLACARLAAKKGVTGFVLDIGMQTPTKGSVVFSALQGAIDAGLKTKFDSGIVDMARISGQHVAAHAKALKQKGNYDKVYSGYAKAGIDAEKLPELFQAAKSKIMSS
ncbi:50S ribosomal protein L18 [Candidatus Parvarchaeota archaeon]|nr:50S ribosomal protein L18 [Candidatus Parvarchaeota archaeon]